MLAVQSIKKHKSKDVGTSLVVVVAVTVDDSLALTGASSFELIFSS